jgi:hypothetical protein
MGAPAQTTRRARAAPEGGEPENALHNGPSVRRHSNASRER